MLRRLDAAGVKPTDMVDCQGGAMTMFGRTLHDDKSDHFGVVTVQYALEHSSDVGAAKMALKIGPDKFYKYMRGFGFGGPVGRGAAERDAGAAGTAAEVGINEHLVDGNRGRRWR